MILQEPAGVRRRAVIAVQIPRQHPQHRHLLAPMMSGVRDSPNHHPRARSRHVKEFRFRLPPNFIFRPQCREPLSAVLSIALHEFQPSLRRRQGRRVDVNPQHADKPQILAHTLVHHLFVHAAPSRVALARTERKIAVAEFTPHAHNFDSLGFIGFHKKFVFHGRPPCVGLFGIIASLLYLRQSERHLVVSLAPPESLDFPCIPCTPCIPCAPCRLTCAAHRSIYTLTRAVPLLPPVSSVRTSERLGGQDAESCPRYP